MKTPVLLLLFFIVISSCSKPMAYTLDFCTELTEDISCEPAITEFELGQPIFVLFECNQPCNEELITSSFYIQQDGKRLLVDTQDWKPRETDTYAYNQFNFKAPGTYEVEFINDKNVLLAKKSLVIR